MPDRSGLRGAPRRERRGCTGWTAIGWTGLGPEDPWPSRRTPLGVASLDSLTSASLQIGTAHRPRPHLSLRANPTIGLAPGKPAVSLGHVPEQSRTINLVGWNGKWAGDDPDANFKADVA